MQHELKLDLTQFNSIQIQFKTNGMQIGGKGIWNRLVNMVLEKKTLKKAQIAKDTFPCLFTWEWAITNSNLELSNIRWLMKPKAIISKPIPMNHCHWNMCFMSLKMNVKLYLFICHSHNRLCFDANSCYKCNTSHYVYQFSVYSSYFMVQ